MQLCAHAYVCDDVFNMPDVEFVSLEEAGLENYDRDTVIGECAAYYADEDANDVWH